MKFKKYILTKTAMLVVAMVAFSNGTYAQEAVNMSTTMLKDEASNLANQKRYLEARPFIAELIKRIEGLDADDKSVADLRNSLDQFYYFEAYGYLQEYDASGSTNKALVAKAIDGFSKVIEKYPQGEFVVESIKMKANCYEAIDQFEKAVETRGMLLKKPFVAMITAKERYELVKRICESLFNSRKWKLGKPWFERLLSNSKNIDDKVFAASALIQGSFAERNFEEAKKYIPYMVHNNIARNDPALNVEFIKAGDFLANSGKVSDATVFYNLVLGKEAMIANFEKFIEIEKNKIAEIKKYNSKSPLIVDHNNKIKTIESFLKAARSLPSLTADMMARNAANFMRTERNYESFWAYYQLMKKFPEHQNIEDFYFASIVCALNVDKLDVMYEISNEYLEKFKEGGYRKDVEMGIVQYHLKKATSSKKKEDYKEFFAKAKKFLDDNGPEAGQSRDVIFLLGKTWFDMKNYKELIRTFNTYLKKKDSDGNLFDESILCESLMYWVGMGYMATSDFEKAMKIFSKMVERFPVGLYAEDGAYRKGVAAFGAGKFEVARDTLESFIETFPKSSLRGEVEFFLGDIYANNNNIEKALKHYLEVENHTKGRTFTDNAYIQTAKLLHNTAEQMQDAKDIKKIVDFYVGENPKEDSLKSLKEDAAKYAKLDRPANSLLLRLEIAVMDSYIKKHPKGNLSEASYNRAKAFEKLGKPADALLEFEHAISKYGSNVKDDAIDRMILEYKKIYEQNHKKLVASVKFLEELKNNRQLLEDMVGVPAKRYRYFQENPNIDLQLYESFKRDRRFGVNLYDDKTPIDELLSGYNAQLKKYPAKPVDVFTKLFEEAQSKKDVVLGYRLMMGLDFIGNPVKTKKSFSDEDLKKASVRTLVWIGSLSKKINPNAARKAYEEGRKREEFEYEVDILFAHAELELEQGNFKKSLELYTAIENEFPSDERAARAVILKGDSNAKLYEAQKSKKSEEAQKYFKAAVKEYESVLRSPNWRGDAYAEALYKLGKLMSKGDFSNQEKINKAVMYYERCYLGYASCYDWTGKALLGEVELKQSLNMDKQTKDELKNRCREFVENALNKSSPEYSDVKRKMETL